MSQYDNYPPFMSRYKNDPRSPDFDSRGEELTMKEREDIESELAERKAGYKAAWDHGYE
jgi:hypothetical protein